MYYLIQIVFDFNRYISKHCSKALAALLLDYTLNIVFHYSLACV